MNRLNSIALAAAITLIPAGAAAAPPIVVEGTPQPTASVSYADLDLASAAGRARLDGRVRRAAAGLCLDFAVRAVGDRMEQKGCMNFAIAGARDQIEQAITLAGRSPSPGQKVIVLAAR